MGKLSFSTSKSEQKKQEVTYVEVIKPVEVIRTVYVDRIVEKPTLVEKLVEVPVEVTKEVLKEVPVEVEVVVEKVVYVDRLIPQPINKRLKAVAYIMSTLLVVSVIGNIILFKG